MDPVTMTFYAIVCGGLAASAPKFNNTVTRLVAGVVTGIVAAMALPFLRSWLGI